MKKRSFLMLLSGMMLLSGGFVSCGNDDNEVNKVNTLSVAPSGSIQFDATGNEDVVLTVTTDAKSWSYTAPDWVVAKQEGKTLTVNAKDNATGGSRAGRIEFKAGNAEPVLINVAQSIPVPGSDNVLSVEPSADIEFNATGNTDVVLTVSTDAESWKYEAPEWITATQEGNKLTVNAKDNTETGTRAGRIEFTAGTAKAVVVNVSQKGAGDQPGGKKVAISLQDESGESNVALTATGKEEGGKIETELTLVLAEPIVGDANVQIFIDEAYLAEYNFINKTECVILPAGVAAITNDGNVTIDSGQTTAVTSLTLDVANDQLKYNTEYLIPLYIKVKSDNVSVSDACRVNYVLKKKNPKEVKNVLYFEVNDTNPLNALEYVMADGSYFFDAIILFAANINYNAQEDRVFLSNNPNVQALLDETDVYLQPLREAGMKVYLGILGNHDAAGVCQLSDWGCQQYAEELALACLTYKLDGVSFDDEYSARPDLSNKWFTSPSAAAGARLCYESKKALTELVPWETEVSIFEWGSMYARSFPATIEGQNVGQYLDFSVANYGGASSPSNGMTMKQCSGMSIECNLGRGSINESSARRIKEDGYGYVMWFAFDPSGSGNIVNNLSSTLPMMKGAAKGLYDTELLDPTGYYNKIGEGEYDPKRYTR